MVQIVGDAGAYRRDGLSTGWIGGVVGLALWFLRSPLTQYYEGSATVHFHSRTRYAAIVAQIAIEVKARLSRVDEIKVGAMPLPYLILR